MYYKHNINPYEVKCNSYQLLANIAKSSRVLPRVLNQNTTLDCLENDCKENNDYKPNKNTDTTRRNKPKKLKPKNEKKLNLKITIEEVPNDETRSDIPLERSNIFL